ncbi:MAG: DUF4249 domain-containing protein [Bacteroidota bacterium]
MKYTVPLFWLILFGFSSCETVVDVDVPREAPRLVVNSFIGVDAPVAATISQSKFVLSNERLREVSGAEVTLLEDDQIVATLEETIPDSDIITTPPGFYTTEFVPSAGREYTIRVSKSGFESVEATAFIPPPIPIANLRYDTITAIYEEFDDSTGNFTTVQRPSLNQVWLGIDDPGDEENFYEVLVQRYSTSYNFEQDDDGNFIITDTFRILVPVPLVSDDPVVDDNDDFFEGDNEVITSGVFLFSDEIFNGRLYTFNFRAGQTFGFGQEEESEYFITLRTLSEAQYRYLLSVGLQEETEGNPFAEPVPVFNNIQGGYGIFVGYSADMDTVDVE